MLFWASLGALLVGPLVLTTLGDRRSVVAFLDGYVMVAVGGLIGLHILPHALHHAGTWALAGAAVGVGLPMILERLLRRLGQATLAHRGTVLLALGGLALHAVMDGLALQGPDAAGHGDHLALGVVLMRAALA